MRNKVYEGGYKLHTPSGTSYNAGDVVVVGTQLGVAVDDIADGEEGALDMAGVFKLPKVTGAVIAEGEAVIWDVSAGAFDDDQATPAAGDVSGAAIADKAAGSGETTVNVRLADRLGTVT